ncbi:MAG: hypothetical protein KC506_01395 [Nanoarchaeota archaeon]|nr:hypothetical protein [Nanoarchaeota archaeon]
MMRTNILKKGQVSMFVIIAVVLVAVIVFIAILAARTKPEEIEFECHTDSDCVPSECCGALNCVPLGEAPSCAGVECVGFCESGESGKLGCGPPEDRGFCGCVNNKCSPIFPSE